MNTKEFLRLCEIGNRLLKMVFGVILPYFSKIIEINQENNERNTCKLSLLEYNLKIN